MFTGIIEEVGQLAAKVPSAAGVRLTLEASLAGDLGLGESIAVNGVCLTVVDKGPGFFAADVSPTTLSTTTLGGLEPQTPVNLERSLRVGDRLSGHWVTGHVDGVMRVVERRTEGDITQVVLTFPNSFRPLVVSKGSIALDGVSLTIVHCDDTRLDITLIPHTLVHTVIGQPGQWVPGQPVNVEYDILGKYIWGQTGMSAEDMTRTEGAAWEWPTSKRG